jgi:hypothetical protein
MVSRWSELIVDCHDPHRLAEFWAAVLDYRVVDKDADGDRSIADRARTAKEARAEPHAPKMYFIKVPEAKQAKNRLHLDLVAADGDYEGELQRLFDLGATKAQIGQGKTRGWTVLADPEGNEFCLLRGHAGI